MRAEIGHDVERQARRIVVVTRDDLRVRAAEPATDATPAHSVHESARSGQDGGDVELLAVVTRDELQIVVATGEPTFVRDHLPVEQLKPGPYASSVRHQAPAFVMIINGIVATAITEMMTR